MPLKPFEKITPRGQALRLRRLGERALQRWGLGDARLKLIGHLENTTFEVISDTPFDLPEEPFYDQNKLLLRVHRAGYHTPAGIASELQWLQALRRDTDLAVPEPVPTPEGEFLVTQEAPGLSAPRVCTLMRWVRGRFMPKALPRNGLASMGELMALLHEHSAGWSRPEGFARVKWNWNTMFRDGGDSSAEKGGAGWQFIPEPTRSLMKTVAGHVRQAMDDLGEGPESFGLIHADLHRHNALFLNGKGGAIDFDDCGFAHWLCDFAVLGSFLSRHSNGEELIREWLKGYARRRPLPADQMDYFSTFIAARRVTLTLWCARRAQEHDLFRKDFSKTLEYAQKDCEIFLKN